MRYVRLGVCCIAHFTRSAGRENGMGRLRTLHYFLLHSSIIVARGGARHPHATNQSNTVHHRRQSRCRMRNLFELVQLPKYNRATLTFGRHYIHIASMPLASRSLSNASNATPSDSVSCHERPIQIASINLTLLSSKLLRARFLGRKIRLYA